MPNTQDYREDLDDIAVDVANTLSAMDSDASTILLAAAFAAVERLFPHARAEDLSPREAAMAGSALFAGALAFRSGDVKVREGNLCKIAALGLPALAACRVEIRIISPKNG